jgi:hypothetical protein
LMGVKPWPRAAPRDWLESVVKVPSQKGSYMGQQEPAAAPTCFGGERSCAGGQADREIHTEAIWSPALGAAWS